ncbi:hypothetical protein [Spiroplasma endosymbiont of Villa modesta]|uniref:hypothetical protein n=1 Tax=Spiroplasma endosymbiont of Villa modesta TaxID=3066293 RepID=UPI00313EBE86
MTIKEFNKKYENIQSDYPDIFNITRSTRIEIINTLESIKGYEKSINCLEKILNFEKQVLNDLKQIKGE